MKKLKCWKKHNDRIYFKNKGRKNAEGLQLLKGEVWHVKNMQMKYIGSGKDKMLKYMKKHDKC